MNMHVRLSLLAVLTLFSALQAVELPKFHYDAVVPEAKNADTGTFTAAPASGFSNDARTPAGMTAARLGENGKLFSWQPSVDARTVAGEAALIDALLSADESLLVVAERLGNSDQLNGTRFVFINLYSGRICGGFTLPNCRISALCAIPGRDFQILACREAQSEVQSPAAILLIDLAKKRIVSESAPLSSPLAALCCDGSSVWYALQKESFFCEADLAELDKELRRTDTRKVVCTLQLADGGKCLQAGEAGCCEFFSLTDQGAILMQRVELPENFAPDWALAVLPGECSALLAQKTGKLFYVSGGAARELADQSAAIGCRLPGSAEAVAGSAFKNQMLTFRFPECAARPPIAPASLRPQNRNRTFRLFGRTGTPAEVIQLDSRGNLFRIFITDRGGRKTPLLLIDKRGMK